MTWDGRLVDIRMGGTTPVQVRFGLERWASALSSFEVPFRDCGTVLESHFRRVFAAEGSPNVGGRWAPLSQRYAQRKARIAPGQPILTLTGTLRRSLSGTSPAAIRDYDSDRMVFGSRLPYARPHQDGSARLPRRPPMDFATAINDRRSVGWALAQVFQAHVVYQRQSALGSIRAPGGRRPPTPIPPARVVERLTGMDLH